MNDLEKYFRQNENRLIDKWVHYFEIYDRHFSRFRDKEIVLLEIGVSQGGSLQMWKNYFGKKAKIYGIDIDSRCKDFEEENITVLIGSQSDRKFLDDVKIKVPAVDILIDDGGHFMVQQIVSFEELFEIVKDDGIYLIEDLHTSYWLSHSGGYKRRGTFIEYSKNFIDSLNAFHSQQKNFKVNDFTKTVDSIHYYDSILVIEKRKKEKPYRIQTGKASFIADNSDNKKTKSIFYKVKSSISLMINKVLQFFRIKNFLWK